MVCVLCLFAVLGCGHVDRADWRADLQAGDLLLERSRGEWGILAAATYWTHIGIYDGASRVIEAVSGVGVTASPLTAWDYPAKSEVAVYRVTAAGGPQREAAVAFARRQADNHKPYQEWPLYWDYSATSEAAWYCSELVWAAYLSAGIDLEPAPGAMGITPSDLVDGSSGVFVGGHVETPAP